MNDKDDYLDIYFIQKLRCAISIDSQEIDKRKIESLQFALDYIQKIENMKLIAKKPIGDFFVNADDEMIKTFKIFLLAFSDDIPSPNVFPSIITKFSDYHTIITEAIQNKKILKETFKPILEFFSKIYNYRMGEYLARHLH